MASRDPWRRIKNAAKDERWVLTAFRWGKVYYYRGGKKYPTPNLYDANTWPDGATAARATNFMHSGRGKYRPRKVTEKFIFTEMLKGKQKERGQSN